MGVRDDVGKKLHDIGGLRVVGGIRAGMGEEAVEHAGHFVHVTLEGRNLGVVDQGKAEAEAGEGGAQVVADP